MTMERRKLTMEQLMYRPGGRDAPTEYLLTVQEAADRLRVSRWSVYNLGLVKITQRRAARQQKNGVGTITRRLLLVGKWFT
jgi:hypothetical protein